MQRVVMLSCAIWVQGDHDAFPVRRQRVRLKRTTSNVEKNLLLGPHPGLAGREGIGPCRIVDRHDVLVQTAEEQFATVRRPYRECAAAR